jgi:hypothetical protein
VLGYSGQGVHEYASFAPTGLLFGHLVFLFGTAVVVWASSLPGRYFNLKWQQLEDKIRNEKNNIFGQININSENLPKRSKELSKKL